MAETNQKHMSLIASLTAIAGLITALFAVWGLWDKHGFATKQEASELKRELAIHILENRLMIMRRELPADPIDRQKHEEQMGRVRGMLSKLRQQQTKNYFVLD